LVFGPGSSRGSVVIVLETGEGLREEAFSAFVVFASVHASLEFCFHLAGVAEVYTTLSFVSDTIAPTLFTAFILESVNRVINVAFKFVPLRTGVDEYGSGALAKVLGFTKATGVTLAIVRKARDIFWTGIGVALMVRRGLSLRGIDKQATAIVDETNAN